MVRQTLTHAETVQRALANRYTAILEQLMIDAGVVSLAELDPAAADALRTSATIKADQATTGTRMS